MPEHDRLSSLQMGIPRHDGLRVLQCSVLQGLQERRSQGHDPVRLPAQIHAQIQGHLIVSASGGVQALTGIPHPRCEFSLHEAVDIFRSRIYGQRAGGEIRQDPFQAGKDGVGIIFRNDALRAEHGGMRHAAPYVLLRHPAVKTDGGVEIVGETVQLAVKIALP